MIIKNTAVAHKEPLILDLRTFETETTAVGFFSTADGRHYAEIYANGDPDQVIKAYEITRLSFVDFFKYGNYVVEVIREAAGSAL